MNLFSSKISKFSSAQKASCLGLTSLILIALQAGAEESRFPGKWNWSALHANELKVHAKAVIKGGDGFWELERNGIRIRTDVSADLTCEASVHTTNVIKAFPQTIKLPPSASRVKNIQFLVTIHRTEETYRDAAPDSDSDLGFSQISVQEDDSSLAEIHLLSKWDMHPGFDNNLVECIDVGLLQGHLTRLLLQLWRPDQPLPPFLEKGYESYFETFDVYTKKTRAAGIHRSAFKTSLQRAILHGETLAPGLSEMLHLSAKDYDSDPEMNGALSDTFVHFLMTNTAKQGAIHQALAPSSGVTSTSIDFKALAALEKGWHQHLYKVLANSRPILHSDFATDANLPGAASVTDLSAYGNKPLLSLMPAPGGAYDLAWYGSAGIHIMRCDARGQKIGEFSLSFINKVGALLGATRLPGDKGYVVGYSTDNSHGDQNTEFWVAGFTPDGSETFNTRIFGDQNLKIEKSKGGPGGAGSARIVYNEKTKTIGFYLSHNMLWGDGVRHQAGFIGFLNEKGKQQPGGNGWFYSHNFDQRLIVADDDFCALAHGDAFPRALGFSRWSSSGNSLANQTYHTIPGESGANTTNCQTGGLVGLPNRRYAVIFATSNEREAHDIGIKILDESGKIVREKWLTTYEKGRVGSYPRIARDGDHIFVAWHEDGEFQQMVLNGSLDTVIPQSGTPDVRLSPYDDLHNLDNGSIAWAVPIEGKKVRVYRIDPPALLEQSLLTRSTPKKRTPKPEALAQVDHEMTLKLAELGAENNLPKDPIPLSAAKKPIRLLKVDKASQLHFTSEGIATFGPIVFDALPIRDRALIALSLSQHEPENLFLYAIAGFYLECSGSLDAANYYYGKSGRTASSQFAKFFD